MPDDPRVDELLEHLLDFGGTPEEACRTCPELLPQVRAGWQRLRALKTEVNALFHEFPFSNSGGTSSTLFPIREGPGTMIGPYKLMEQIGEGGFGLVFVAEQTQPVKRKVALKVIKPGMDSRQVIARFEAERQALAMMDHPNIARVLDAGTTESGLPYFVMELVLGIPITDYCDRKQLSPKDRLELFISVCHAIQHAHQKGIIHRDIKPSNVLVGSHDAKPVAKVIDFGVAKAISHDLTPHTAFTNFAQMIGTPLYMSPEQAELSILDIDTRSDIYSLGVLLYELLTGSTPLDRQRIAKAAFDEVRRIIREEDPPKPSQRLSACETPLSVAASRKTESVKLSRMLKGELDWVVMKALEKDRSRRYETASALARDIQRYLNDEVVEALPPNAGYRFRKFVRKYRAPIRIASAFLVLLVLGVIASTWQAVRATVAERTARASEEDARNQKREADAAKQKAEQQRDELRRLGYIADMNLARLAWDENNLVRMRELLDKYQPRVGETDLRGFEWHYLGRLLNGDLRTVKAYEGWVTAISFAPDGQSLYTSGIDRAPQGMKVFDYPAGQVKRWDAATGKPLPLQLKGLPATLDRVTLSHDGAVLAATCRDHLVRLWNMKSGDQATLEGPTKHIASGAGFSPDGTHFVSIHQRDDVDFSKNSTSIRIWDLKARRADVTIERLPYVTNARFSPNGKLLAVCLTYQGLVKVFDEATGVVSYECGYSDGIVIAAIFSPDGHRLYACGGKGIRVWDTASHEVLAVWPTSTSMGYEMVFSPNGERLALAGGEGTVEVWDTAKGQVIQTLKGHSGSVYALAFHPDGLHLVTGGHDGTLRLWDVKGESDAWTIGQPSTGPDVPEISPSGQTYLSGLTMGLGSNVGAGHSFQLWDIATRQRRGPPIEFSHLVRSCNWSGDGKRLYLTDESKTVTVVDATAGEIVRSYPVNLEMEGEMKVVTALSPDEKWFAHPAPNGTIEVRDAHSGTSARQITGLDDLVHNLAFSNDGSLLASADANGTIKIWDVATGASVATTQLDGVYVFGLRFSPNGKRLAVVGDLARFFTGAVRIIATETGHEIWSLRGHTLNVTDCAFSPDGQRLATASIDKTVRVWDLVTGQEALRINTPQDSVTCIRMISNGRLLIGAGSDRRINIWDASPIQDKD